MSRKNMVAILNSVLEKAASCYKLVSEWLMHVYSAKLIAR